MKKESRVSVNVEKNKDSNINITIGQVDELSCDNIRRNYDDVVTLENEFSDRLEYSKDVLTKKLLPKQLQDDFEIVPRYVGNIEDSNNHIKISNIELGIDIFSIVIFY